MGDGGGGPLEAAMGCTSGTLLGLGGFSQWYLLDTAIKRKKERLLLFTFL